MKIRSKIHLVFVLAIVFTSATHSQTFRKISKSDLRDKIMGYWIGQCIGNFLGFPFEGTYLDTPVPVLIDRYYQLGDDPALVINKDLRGYCPVVINWMGGAFSDDDTDIEFVTLHAVEEYGLDITYPEITGIWKEHINRNIWCANRSARDLMSQGIVAPETGNKLNNENWYQIDPQLVNEIWSMFYPGMINKSAEKVEWGARITNDDWGTHPTVAYGVMYSAAVFEQDVQKLVELALNYIPATSPFHEGMLDVIDWHKEYNDWRETRKLIFDKYYYYKKGDYSAPVSDVSSLSNGLLGIMALLYGNGDFVKTAGIAVSAGLDCDNQAATCAGLIGVIYGADAIPGYLKYGMNGKAEWDKPFNDTYINFTRDNLPNYTRISDLANRILAVAEDAIVANGGMVTTEAGDVIYLVNSDLDNQQE